LTKAEKDIAVRMHGIMRRLVHQHVKALSLPGPESDMTRTQLSALFQIGRSGTTAMGSLAEELDIAPGSLTGIVDRLIEKGFVRRDRDTGDRRKVVVALTPQGVEAFAQFQEAEGRFTEKMFSLLSPEEGDTLVRLMERLVGGLETAGGAAPPADDSRPARS
jgi:DNA-binding MarR family transcriptional regulator